MRWTISKITQTFAFSVFIFVLTLGFTNTSTANPSDVRVLVDVSGSMKKADPQAVRGPATALLAALLPDQSQGGIWLFGSDVRELVPYGPVDARWDALGQPIEASIGSTDRFTHMESALRTGITAGEQNSAGACHVILITDGIVDVQGGQEASSASRDRILKTVLPDAVDKGCRIHTIALSDKADLPLLRQMAIQTNGLFTLLKQPGDLIPVMLDALELALRSQQLPISEQQINIDSDIRQVRLIRLDSGSAIELRSDSDVVNADSQLPGITYYSGTGYQTLIWSNPIAGRYSLSPDWGPADRVLIDSHVRLELAELPPTISADQTLGLSASIQNSDGVVVPSPSREYRIAFGERIDPIRSAGDQLTLQIDSPPIGRSILTIQSFDQRYERQVQRAFEVLVAQPALEIATNTAQGVRQVSSTIQGESSTRPASKDSEAKMSHLLPESITKLLPESIPESITKLLPESIQSLLPKPVTNQLPEDTPNWPLWQLIVSALGAIAVVALVVGLVLRPKHRLPK